MRSTVTRQTEINDPQTLRGMYSYVISESGKMVAEEPSHDDCVISLAIAAHIQEGRWILCPEELYVEAIREYWMCSGPLCATSRTYT